MKRIAIEWKNGRPEGLLEILNGKLEKALITKGEGGVEGEKFAFVANDACRLVIAVDETDCNLGSNGAIVTVRTVVNPFSFFLRDICSKYPIFIPEYGVVVTEADDDRSYRQIEETIRSRGLQTNLQHIENEPEESYEVASANTRRLRCPTWLGLSRDMRIFEVGFREGTEIWDWIQPRFHGYSVPLSEASNTPVRYNFTLGRGISCVENISRRLEEGALPILHGVIIDDDISYNFTTFVTLESTKLALRSLRGTHSLVADGFAFYGHGGTVPSTIFPPQPRRTEEEARWGLNGIVVNFQTKEQENKFRSLLPEEMNREEETVLYFRIEAVNTASVPQYAWFKTVFPSARQALEWSFDGKNGLGVLESARVFCISKLNGKPMPEEETAVLLKPGEVASFEFLLPHRPISKERALRLAEQNFEMRHAECREFWKRKLKSAAQLNLPELRLDEMMRAGLLHLDLVAYGLEPAGTVAPTIGIYCVIGSESAPIIHFIDSMGWHDLARRCLMFYLDIQREDGSIQNCSYRLETGCALWSMGEHYRYTRDDAWVKQIEPKLLKACEYILNWRKLNQKEELRGRGYGMLEGQVGDPIDPYHYFILNGYAYLGLSRVAEMLSKLDPVQSKTLLQEAVALKKDVRVALFEAMAKSPVIPIGDGTWCPTFPPWAEAHGPVCLFAERGKWFTHGTFLARDSLVGPLYLVFQEVIEPEEQVANWLLGYHTELMLERNVATSQPYYSPHPWVHLRRGEVKPFLKDYYNNLAGLADRETYSFWEHFFHASPHKTHEEAQFLMQTRWMLYMEQGETLKMLPGIPRAWMKNGECIELNRVASYFGPVSLKVESKLEQGRIEARVGCSSDRQPKRVELRLPHPQGRKASKVKGGVYDANTETVRIEPFKDHAEVTLEF